MEDMKIVLSSSDYDLRFPVLPASFDVQNSQGNEVVTVHTVGEVNLLGKAGLKTIDLSSFFPNQDYNFAYNVGRLDPYEYINRLIAWKDAGTILALTVTQTNISFNATIESLTYGENDMTGDVNFTLQLKEYRTLTRMDKVSAAGGSGAGSGSGNTYITKKGDTLKAIAKKFMGETKYSKTIYAKNKKVIEAALKKYVKAENKKIKKYNKTHNPKKKLLTWKSSDKGARLKYLSGVKLVIPPKPKKTTTKKNKAKKSKKKKK